MIITQPLQNNTVRTYQASEFNIILSLLKNQKSLKIRKKHRKIFKNINQAVALLNYFNNRGQIYCILPTFSYARRLLACLVNSNLLFSFYVWKHTKGFINDWFNRYKYEQIAVELALSIVFFRFSTAYGKAFRHLKIVSTISRHLYFSHKAFIRIFIQASNRATKLYLFNTCKGLLKHTEAIKLKIGGNLVIICM